ncbi:hypothetical protein TSUD_198270 [Trifolium subterraneum]|uniref:Uncharacterized protein n=1 Tax=Trifolium subterraneum TaxID=3900 RepID=A0A2Z6PMZ6_TRISU|nr:hypothetical protein TSUD_198270 [Trifolium subterraneum]
MEESLSTMVIKSESEKKSKKKFGMKHKCRVRSRNPNTGCGCAMAFHFHEVGDDWLPFPKHKHAAYLADIDASAKARAEGNPALDLDKYFQGPGNVCKPKPVANWKELLREKREELAAKAKANSLKRERKKAYKKKLLLKKEKECVCE